MNSSDCPKKCANCGKTITREGHVYGVFRPAIVLLLGVPGEDYCDDCASCLNLIGYLVTMGLVLFALVALLVSLKAGV